MTGEMLTKSENYSSIPLRIKTKSKPLALVSFCQLDKPWVTREEGASIQWAGLQGILLFNDW